MCQRYNILCSILLPYYSQGNSLAESTNKNLLKIIKHVIDENPREWHLHLTQDLWEDHTKTKTLHGKTPFFLVYGQETIMHVELEIATYRLAFQTKELDSISIIQHYNAILALDEK